MSRVVIVHGFNSWPSSHWFPWIKKELEAEGHSVLIPDLPKPLLPDYSLWMRKLTDTVGAIDENTVFVGHSLGAITALLYIQSRPESERCTGFVGVAPLAKQRYDLLVGTFFEVPLRFEELKRRIPKMLVLSDPKDHLVPFDDAKYLVEKMQCDLIACANRGHFDGRLNRVTEAKEILQAIHEIEKQK